MSFNVAIIGVGVIPQLPRSLYLPDAAQDEFFDVPCFCYVVTDGSTVFLVDSGPDARAAEESGYRIAGDTTRSLLGGLSACGVEPGDVGCIVHTHLHYDHVQNDGLFPAARVIVQAAEIEWATSASSGAFYAGVEELRDAVAGAGRLEAIEGSVELAPGLRTIFNRGHTPGHQSVLVDTAEGTVCLCGDIVSLHENAEIIGPICPDVVATRAFLDLARGAGWEMIPSHDPGLREHRWFVGGAA